MRNSDGPKKYGTTFAACCAAYVSHAAVVNLTPLLFIPLSWQYGFSYAQLGALVLVNFLTQLAADVGFGVLIDRYGFRLFVVAGHVFMTAGFVFFAAVPRLPVDPYAGFVAATLIFSVGGGCMELIISPIVNALPAKEKSASMSLLHSFYCWGHVGVALFTTLFIHVFGRASWPALFMIFAALPLINTFVFIKCPLAPPVPSERRSSAASVLRNPMFLIIIAVIIFSGASEITFAQWTSAFMEDVMELPKIVGDIAGICVFAAMMGTARTLNGVKGKTKHLRYFMLAGAMLAFVCYITVALTESPSVGLAACALCGLGVSLLWPGALSLSAEAFPLAGSWMMAMLAAGGDTGASIGPYLAGLVADAAGLRAGMLVSSVFPLAVVALLLAYVKMKRAAD